MSIRNLLTWLTYDITKATAEATLVAKNNALLISMENNCDAQSATYAINRLNEPVLVLSRLEKAATVSGKGRVPETLITKPGIGYFNITQGGKFGGATVMAIPPSVYGEGMDYYKSKSNLRPLSEWLANPKYGSEMLKAVADVCTLIDDFRQTRIEPMAKITPPKEVTL